MLTNKIVYLEKDVSETDKYGRLLRYVWLSIPENNTDKEIKSKMFNAILLLNGYGQVMTIPPDVKYSDKFVEYQKIAREQNKGLWALKTLTATTNSETNKATIKSKENMNKIVYWTPAGKSYHYSKDCKTLKRSKTIIKGTLKEALEKGKKDPCNICVK